MKALGWAWFVVVQLIMLCAALVGALLVLPIACGDRAWTTCNKRGGWYTSVKDGRPIDQWSWRWMNPIWGNPEDGVSGARALVWNATGTAQVPFNIMATPWRAYCWNLQNSANQLSYTFGWKNGPYYSGKRFHAGWKNYYGRSRVVLGINS
jgi:hypothetical protein